MDELTYFLLAAALVVLWKIYQALDAWFWHPLAKFPGPRLGALTRFYKAYFDCAPNESFVHHLEKLHKKYGDVVRVGPNELHFADPLMYPEIYNSQNRWDKEKTLYHSFGEDESSFGYLSFNESRKRRDVVGSFFANVDEVLLQEKVIELCKSFENKGTSSVDLFYAFRCMSMEVITYLSFGKSVNAINAPDHKAPIIMAMDASLPVFVRFKHSPLYKNMIMNCPPRISKIISPATSGLIELQTVCAPFACDLDATNVLNAKILKEQIKTIRDNPSELVNLAHSNTIYHKLLDREAYKTGTVPSHKSLYEETQALMFGGADTTGTTLMHGMFCILHSPEIYQRMQEEILQCWPDLNHAPGFKEIKELPYLTAVIKECLRISPGAVSPLPRVVPPGGATIGDTFIPENTVVEMSSRFVHRNPSVFEKPDEFRPERWLGGEGYGLDKWLVTFSRGPRQCIGQRLAWAELYLCFAHVFRKFDLEIDTERSPEILKFRDCFLPKYDGKHLHVNMTPVME